MHQGWRRIGGSLVGACLLFTRSVLDATTLPVALILAVLVFRTWPGLAAHFPIMNQWTVTADGWLAAAVLSIGTPFRTLFLDGRGLTPGTLAPRAISLFLGVFAIALMASVVISRGRQTTPQAA